MYGKYNIVKIVTSRIIIKKKNKIFFNTNIYILLRL